jgi:DNA topoisomerase-1
VDVNGSELRFEFKGKGGKRHCIDVHDRRLAQIVKKCQDLPGQELFQYLDDEGKRQEIRSTDVNDYLREIAGEEFTAKDFRTWAGTVIAAIALQACERCESAAQVKRNIVRAFESVAERLGNTPTICRKCYVHPQILNAYLDGSLHSNQPRAGNPKARSAVKLTLAEAAVLEILEHP